MMTTAISSPGSKSPRGVVLLDRADGLLTATIGAHDPSDRFLGCYVAALRGAAAVLAVVDLGSARRRSRSAWVLMAKAAPELTAWSDYFSAHSSMRTAVEAGASRIVTDDFADAFYRSVAEFLGVVEEIVGSDPHLTPNGPYAQPLTA